MIDFYARVSQGGHHSSIGWQIFGALFVIVVAICVRPRGGGQ